MTRNSENRNNLYLLRGDIVTIGSRIELLRDRLWDCLPNEPGAAEICPTCSRPAHRKWDRVEHAIEKLDLGEDVDHHMRTLLAYNEPRNLAAHSQYLMATVGSDTQVIRWNDQKNESEIVTGESLEDEVEICRNALSALQEIIEYLMEADGTIFARMDNLTNVVMRDAAI